VKLALGLLLLAACSQSYEDGVRTLCDGPAHCVDTPAPDRGLCVAEWARDHVKNDDVRKQLSAMAMSAGSKLDALRVMLKQAGILESQCPLVDLWTAPPAQPAQGK
jgi:hypothetical protein